MVDLDVSRVDLVKEGADDNAFIKYYKSKEGGTNMFKTILAKLKPEDKQAIEDEIAKQVAKAKEEALASKEDEEGKPEEGTGAEEKKEKKPVEKAKEQEQDDLEEVLKSLDPRVKAMFDAVNAKATAAEAVAKSLVEKELEAEAVAKAKEVMGTGASQDQLVKIYKSLKELDPELCTEVFGIFKSAANVKGAGEGIFETVAKTKGTVEDTSGGSAWDKIMTEATEIAKSKGITEAAAVSEVVKQKPDLYREYLAELKK